MSKATILVADVSALGVAWSILVAFVNLEVVCSFWWCFVRFGGDQLFGGGSVQFGDSIIGSLF